MQDSDCVILHMQVDSTLNHEHKQHI